MAALAIAAFTWLDDPAPADVKATCARSSEAGFPGAFSDRDNLVIGPLVLVGAGRATEYSESFGGQKFQALVRNGHRVTVAVPRSARPAVGLAYGPLPNGEVSPPEAHRAVKFVACRRGEHSGSTAEGRPVTFWSGGVLARSPRCVPIRVRADDRPPRGALIRLGVTSCD